MLYIILVITLTIIYIVEVNRRQNKINQELDLERTKSKQMIDLIKAELDHKNLYI